jgi:hypothetical protein
MVSERWVNESSRIYLCLSQLPRELSCSQGVSIYSLPTQTSRLDDLVGFSATFADSPPATGGQSASYWRTVRQLPQRSTVAKNGVVRTSRYSLTGQSAIQDRTVRLDETFCLRCWRQIRLSGGAGLSGLTSRTIRFRREVQEISLCVPLFSHVPCFSRYAIQRLDHKSLSKFPRKRTSTPLNSTAI